MSSIDSSPTGRRTSSGRTPDASSPQGCAGRGWRIHRTMTPANPAICACSGTRLHTSEMKATTVPSSLIVGRVLAIHVRDDCVLDAARCYIDTPKLGLIARMHGGSEANADAVAHLPAVWISEVARAQAFLDIDGAAYRFDRAGKFCKKCIARGIEDAAASYRD